MFYYPNVLQRHTGCFSTIWLAATKGIRIPRRELLKVNIGRTCDDIMDYVTVQVAPLHPNLPRPRFSLYLSSQLQYGVVIVYHRQCAVLLEETQQVIERLLRSERHLRIDMPEPDRLALDMPDSLMLMEEAEGAQDPFFGMMGLQQLPSPYAMFQPRQLMEKGLQQSPLVSTLQSQEKDHGFKSPLDTITLKEREQLVIDSAEFQGAELPEATAKEIDMLLEQKDQFYGDVEEREKEREAEKTTDVDGAMTSIDQLKDSVVGADRDSLWLLDEETGQPVEVPLERVPLEMTPVLVAIPTTPGSLKNGQDSERESRSHTKSPHRDGPKKRESRRKQLIFADPHVQIPQEAMMEQINNPMAETLTLAQCLIDLPFLTNQSLPLELFSAPSSSHLHRDLMSLWRQCAVLTTLQRSGERSREQHKGMEEDDVDKMDSEPDREMLRGENRGKKSGFREGHFETRALSEISGASEGRLNTSKEDKSVDVITPVSRWSPQEEVQVPMEPIVEEQVEIPEREQDIEVTADSLFRMVSSCVKRFGQVTFHSLLSPEADRSSAAQMLSKLLELVSARQLSVLQTEPYSPITIGPGLLACFTA